MANRGYALHLLSNAEQWVEVFSMPRCSATVDWWGVTLERPFRYAIGLDSRYLVFVSEVPQPPPTQPQYTCGAFVENLAEPQTGCDTAELFIMGRDGNYFELHVNPDGAWWYMQFSGYRVRVPGMFPSGVDVRIQREPDSWIGAIRVPRERLFFPADEFERFQATVALCSGSEVRYVSSSGCQDFEPDFHDIRAFSRLIQGG